MRISDWSSDVCSSDLYRLVAVAARQDNARPPAAIDVLLQLRGPRAGEVVGHVRGPDQLQQVEAEPLAVDELQGEVVQPVQAGPVAAFAHEAARDHVGPHVAEAVDLLHDRTRRVKGKRG